MLPPTNTPKLDRRCASHPNKGLSALPGGTPSSPQAETLESSSARSYFSAQAIYLAEIIDVLPRLNELSAVHPDQTRTIEFLELRQRLTDRILLALFEVSSTVAEIICERDRADQIADRMDEIDTSRVKGLTLASIVLGGVASIVSGGIGLAGGATTASDAVEVGGGVLASAFGGTALFTKSQQEVKHERNRLSELWNDPPASDLFSPSIWRFLHHRHGDSSATSSTPREELITAWRQQGRLGQPGGPEEQKRIALFFGSGGKYDSSDLRARASMLETLEATIRLMNQELELFVREISLKSDGARK